MTDGGRRAWLKLPAGAAAGGDHDRPTRATGPVRPAGAPERAHKRPGAAQGYFPPAPERCEPLTAQERTDPAQFRPGDRWCDAPSPTGRTAGTGRTAAPTRRR